MTHICVSNITIIGSDNGLSPGRRQAIIGTNAGIMLFWHLGTNFNDISIEFHIFSFKKMHFKRSSGKWRPCCLGINVLCGSILVRWQIQLLDEVVTKLPNWAWILLPMAKSKSMPRIEKYETVYVQCEKGGIAELISSPIFRIRLQSLPKHFFNKFRCVSEKLCVLVVHQVASGVTTLCGNWNRLGNWHRCYEHMVFREI